MALWLQAAFACLCATLTATHRHHHHGAAVGNTGDIPAVGDNEALLLNPTKRMQLRNYTLSHPQNDTVVCEAKHPSCCSLLARCPAHAVVAEEVAVMDAKRCAKPLLTSGLCPCQPRSQLPIGLPC